MKLIILHLSDSHIQSSQDLILTKADQIAAATSSAASSAVHIFVVVTGDIAFSGDSTEYDEARRFLLRIRDLLHKECRCPVDLIVVPGNHDCNFRLDTAARRHLVESLLSTESPEIDSSVIEQCTKVQEPFIRFRDSVESITAEFDDGLWRTFVFAVGTKRIAFECLNLSWMSQRAEVPGRIFFPVESYRHVPVRDADVRIAVMHEPFNWLNQAAYRPLRTIVRRISDIVVSGHEHVGNVGVTDEAASGHSAFVEGCVLQETGRDLQSSAFNVIAIDAEKSCFSVTRYLWNGGRYSASEEGSWVDYHDLPRRSSNPLPIQPDFLRVLDDTGGPIRHPARQQITLGDLFVYPDLIEVTDQPVRRLYKSSVFLANPESIGAGILLEGDEKSGRTSLLHNLFREYHDRDYYPLLLRGDQLTKEDQRSIERATAAAIAMQYGAGGAEQLMQLERNKRIVLIDDFDLSRIKSSAARREMLQHLRSQFGYVLLSVTDSFELSHAALPEDEIFLTFSRFRIQPFGYRLRGQLVAKWHMLGADGTVDERTLLAHCDHSERIINDVMKRTLIPAVPLYLLTLLQSIEAGRSGEFKDSALGYYYQFLLTDNFSQCGVKADKLTELFQYCTHLAWFFHSRNVDSLDEVELRSFNDRFSREWHTVDFPSRLEVLIGARILCAEDTGYRFRYPYTYYYFKGQYLGQHLDDLDTRSYIQRCCEHLYVRDHAHTILFLAHHTNDLFVLRAIEEALQRLFAGLAPVRFCGDTRGISRLIDDVPRLTYTGGRPEDHREQRNRLRDKLEENSQDGLREREEQTNELSLAAQLMALLKTIEILGQVLKNQYSKITRKRKAELVTEVFSGPLRALRSFYAELEATPDALLTALEAALSRLDRPPDPRDIAKIARRIVDGIVLLISYGLVSRAADSANSESLREDVEGVIERDGTVAFRLIDLAIWLDSPRPLPRTKIKALLKAAQNEPLAVRILQLLVLNRLYMFRTSEKDLQWLSTDLDLNIGAVHRIAYSTHTGRRLIER